MTSKNQVLQQLKRSIANPSEISDGYVVRQEITDCLILHQNGKEDELRVKLHKLFGAFVKNAYPKIVEELGFSDKQHRVAIAYLGDFTTNMIDATFAVLDNAHRSCTAVSPDAWAALHIFAMIQNIPHDLDMFFQFESVEWDYEDHDDGDEKMEE